MAAVLTLIVAELLTFGVALWLVMGTICCVPDKPTAEEQRRRKLRPRLDTERMLEHSFLVSPLILLSSCALDLLTLFPWRCHAFCGWPNKRCAR